jgi:hypothetical protein
VAAAKASTELRATRYERIVIPFDFYLPLFAALRLFSARAAMRPGDRDADMRGKRRGRRGCVGSAVLCGQHSLVATKMQ